MNRQDELESEEQRVLDAFARRASALLQASVADLDGATRSRLTRARYAALEQRSRATSHTAALWQRWLPAGAISAAVLSVLLVVGQSGSPPMLPAANSGAADDIELLADADGLALAQEQDVDYEFYEWAVGSARDAAPGGTVNDTGNGSAGVGGSPLSVGT